MKKTRVAIQGIEGSFHHIAAKAYFKDSEIHLIPAETFTTLIDYTLDTINCDYGIMAIENSTAGSILQNYGLLQESGLKIEGEIYINVKQNLLALKGTKIEDLYELHSHPMAIQQCRRFIKNKLNKVRIVETADTAFSAKNISKLKLKKIAGIASDLAAELFNLNKLVEDIQTIKKNQTRFFILTTNTQKNKDFDKASIYFNASHEVGSLYKVLEQISNQNINLSKLQSFPFPEKNWQYFFHADLEFDHVDQYHNAIANMKHYSEDLIVLGEYKRGERIFG